MSNWICSLLKNSLSNSTFHGCSRLSETKSKCVRTFWMLLVSSCLIGFFIHALGLYHKCRLEELATIKSLKAIDFEFPDIIVCHTVPLAESYFVQLIETADNHQFVGMWLKRAKYLSKLASRLFYILHSNATNNTEVVEEDNVSSHIRKLASELLQETYNYSKILDYLGHKPYQTVTSITVNNRKVSNDIVHRIFDRYFDYCFRINAIDLGLKANTIENVEIGLYMDNNSNFNYTWAKQFLAGQSSTSFGIEIYFVAPGTQINRQTETQMLRSGYYYDIQLEMVKYELYNLPDHRPCYKSLSTSFVNPIYPTNHQFPAKLVQDNYYRNCFDIEIQEALIKKCTCHSYDLTKGLLSLDVYKGTSNCYNISEFMYSSLSSNQHVRLKRKINFQKLLHRYQCVHDFLLEFDSSNIRKRCSKLVSCLNIFYVSSWSIIELNQSNADYVSDMIKKYFMEPLLDCERRLGQNACPGLQKVLLNYSEYNFGINKPWNRAISSLAVVNIKPLQLYSPLLTEDLAYPVVNFLSDLGGIMGLYLGVSVLTLLEIIQLLHNIFDRVMWIQKSRQKHETA